VNPAAWEVYTGQATGHGPFARAVSELADEPADVIAACADRDMREVAELVSAARRVGRMHYRALQGERR
jgi:hypothetical protein